MYKSLVVGLGLLLVSVGGSACSKSTNTSAAGTGGMLGGTSGASATGASATGASGASGASTGTGGAGGMTCTPAPAPAAPSIDCMSITDDPDLPGKSCNNVHDKCFLTNNNLKVREIGSLCATGMLLTPAPECKSCVAYSGMPEAPEAVSCFTSCAKAELTTAVHDAPSDECLLCPDKVVICGAKFCLSQCISNGLAPACTKCLCETHKDAIAPGRDGNCLIDVFQECLGYKVSADQAGCNMTGTAGSGAAGASANVCTTTGGSAGNANLSMCLAARAGTSGGVAGHAGSAGAAGSAGSAGAAGHAGSAGSAGASGAAGHAGASGAAGHAGASGAAGQ